jgi:hypothetical protein
VKRTVTIRIVCQTETDYHLVVGFVSRRLQHGEVRGEDSIGFAAYNFEVATDHRDAPAEPESDCG